VLRCYKCKCKVKDILCLIVAVLVCSEQEILSTLVLHQTIAKSTNDEEKRVRRVASKSVCGWAC
jgi:hypothetical protein